MNDDAELHCVPARCRARMRGFTLIEVLAALIIVSLGMLGVIEAVSQTVSHATYLRDKTMAHWIGMNRLAEVRLAGRVPEITKSDGQLEYAGQRWRWKMNVTQTPVKSMRRIDINVRRDGSPETSSLAAITGFYGTAVERPGVVSTTKQWGPIPGLNTEGDGDGANPRDPKNPRNPQTQPTPPDEPPDQPTGPVPEPDEEESR